MHSEGCCFPQHTHQVAAAGYRIEFEAADNQRPKLQDAAESFAVLPGPFDVPVARPTNYPWLAVPTRLAAVAQFRSTVFPDAC